VPRSSSVSTAAAPGYCFEVFLMPDGYG